MRCTESPLKKGLYEQAVQEGKGCMTERTWIRELTIPADRKEEEGSLLFCDLAPELGLILIDIHSKTIPELYPSRRFSPDSELTFITVNYCTRGRCELELRNGEYTYLSAGEIAVDSGQARRGNASFYYPTGEYTGIELMLLPGNHWKDIFIGAKERNPADEIQRRSERFGRPRVVPADEGLAQALGQAEADARRGMDREIILLDILRFLYLLLDAPIEEERRRDYYTQSQVAIAKKVMEILSADPARRYAAGELAARFGISETSLKNYFRGVFGCGYGQYQKDMRMHLASRLLAETEDAIGTIAQQTGFSSQSKFGKAFKDYYGITPLEYRRRERIGR